MEIVGIGNALMDVIAFVDEAYTPMLGFHNNTVAHVDREALGAIVEGLPEAIVSAGGGAANVVRAAAYLGAEAAYAGMVGEDRFGAEYRAELEASGVEALLSLSDAKTGVYCALIRPEGGRTLLVSPAAALDLCLEPPRDALFRKGAVFFAECFLLRDRAFFVECLRRARDAGMEVAIDLSSRELTSQNRDFLLAVLPEFCDILFANEDEFVALADLPLREGIGLLAGEGSGSGFELVVKRAELGAVWAQAGRVVSSPVREMRPVDETGAGDAFAAGFLYGRSLGLPPERSLRLGNRVAEEVLGVPGFGVDPKRVRRAAEAMLEPGSR
jgi:sugar/nucleoside kinase (ribokinase family)